MNEYYTLLIPWEPNASLRTPWHPTTQEGDFSVLTRGAFASEGDARSWATENLGAKATFTVKFVDEDARWSPNE